MKMGEFYMTVDKEKNEVIIQGVDFGPGPYALIEIREDYVAFRVKGYPTWDGIGRPQRYVPARFHIVRWVSKANSTAEEIVGFDVRAQVRQS